MTTHLFLAALCARGHSVDVFTTYRRTTPEYDLDGVRVHSWSRRALSEAVAASDAVVAHLGDDGHGALWAGRHGKPLVRMVHGDPQGRVGAWSFSEHHPTDLAVFNSSATRAAYGWHGPSVVIHPPINPDHYRTTPGLRVTLVNLAEQKGGALFWRLTRALPAVPFLGVSGAYGKQVITPRAHAALVAGVHDAAPNVAVMPTQDDARAIYERTRILLVPSERESFGRVAVEAMCSGIPVIAHPTPGLMEACGDAAIWCDRNDDAQWRDAILALQNQATWDTWSAKALAHTCNLDPHIGIDRFCDTVESLVKVAA